MTKCKRYSKMWFLVLLLVAFVTGCGHDTGTDTAAQNSAKAITGYSLDGVAGVINETSKTIAVPMPFGTDVTAMVATFTTTGVSVKVGSATQTSASTATNFTNPVAYIVTAADGTMATYTVTVTVAPNFAKAITAFSLNGVAGVINETSKTIAVPMPFFETVPASLIATFTTTGASVKIGTTTQTSGTTGNNFTNPVAYIVTAADGTTAIYTVTVTFALDSAAAITAFSLDGVAGVINETSKTIAVPMPFEKNVTAMVATFTTTGASVKVDTTTQASGTTANNFTSPVDYLVTAANGTAIATYTVIVTVAPNFAKAITAFSLDGVAGVINETSKTIAVPMPFGTDVTAMVATFTTTGASVKVGTTTQTSGTTANGFTGPVSYIVTAADGTTATYMVTVTVALDFAKAITAFSLDGVAGTINETSKSIAVTMPFGTVRASLVATFTTTGASVKIGTTTQISGFTAHDFTNSVDYIVTAADGFMATYTVTVTNALDPAAAITAFSLDGVAGTVNEAAKTIAVTMPYGTDPAGLVGTFTTTGASVKIGTTTQISGITSNNFTSPKEYIVTAVDDTTIVTYTVTVTVAPNFAKAITAFSLDGVAGTVNEAAKTIAVTMPYGTDPAGLVATFTTTGASVRVTTIAQISGFTANDFTNPVVYFVTADDGTTTTYTVTVTNALDAANEITAYSFAGYTGASGTINEAAKTIAVTVPNGTVLTTLAATFTTTGANVKVGTTVQTSTATANDFSSPVEYIVTAANADTATYTVTVTVAPATAKAITAYSFAGYTGATGTIDEAAKTIAVTVPNGTDVTALVATFTTTGANVKVGTTVQTSTATANNFTTPVIYTVTAADSLTVNYTVTVTEALSAAKALTAFSFAGYTGATGTINETIPKTIAVTVPNGTDRTALIATFTTTGVNVKVGTTVQTSTATPNNFTSPKDYIVTAGDGTTATYTVTVTEAPSAAKAITAYSFAGYTGATGTIDEPAKTIAVTVPNGTDVTALVATFTTTGANVKVGTTVQTSTATPNDFTSPKDYIVTAGDGTIATYTVTVSLPLGPAPVFLGTAGTFAVLAKSGISTVPISAITGNIGVSPAAATFITGFALIADSTNVFSTSTQVTGQVFAADYAVPTPSNMTTAIGDMEIAFTDAAGRTTPDFTELGAGNISVLPPLVPGLYKWGTGVLITNAGVTLSGGPNDVWIFQIAGDLTVNNDAIIALAGGAQAKNIFWQVSGQVTMGTAADFKGIVLSQTLVSLATGAKVDGRLLAQTAVTLDQSTVTQPAP